MFTLILKTLRSLRFTIFLIICLASVFLLSVIIPQRELLGRDAYLLWKQRNSWFVSFLEAINLTDIYVSPITLILWTLFFLNLIFIMSKRIPSIWGRCFYVDIPEDIEEVKGLRHYGIIEGADTHNVKTILKKNGYKFFETENRFHATKNRFSPLITILFHLSFFLLLIGGVVSFYTRFSGGVELAVGETFDGQYSWMKRQKIGRIPFTRFTVEDIRPVYYNKTVPVNLDVVLQTGKGREVIGINKPYKEGSLTFVIQDLDVAPLFIIKDKKGNEIDGAYIKLKVLGGSDDSFRMLGYEFRTVFYTDYYAAMKGRPDKTPDMPQVLKQFPRIARQSQPKEVIHPAFKIAVFKDGRFLSEGAVKMGEGLQFKDYIITFKDLTYWVKFYVVKEYGLGLIYAGFALITISLIIRFVFYRRDIKGVIKNGNLHIGGRGEFYNSAFEDEFKQINKFSIERKQ